MSNIVGNIIKWMFNVAILFAGVLLFLFVVFFIIGMFKALRDSDKSALTETDSDDRNDNQKRLDSIIDGDRIRKSSSVESVTNSVQKTPSVEKIIGDKGTNKAKDTITINQNYKINQIPSTDKPSVNEKTDCSVKKSDSEKIDSIQKGKVFEAKVANHVRYKYPSIKVLTNRIYTVDGKSSEVDLILISDRGIISVECKSFNGLVVGNLKMKDWDVYYSKNNKFKILSPLLQNKGHIRTIKSVVNVSVENLVIFDDCTKVCDNLIKLDNIINFRDLDTFIFNFLSNEPIYEYSEVEYLYNELRDRGSGDLTSHVDYVNSVKVHV